MTTKTPATQVALLLEQLCGCTAIDISRRGQHCFGCGRRIPTRLEERWLWSQLIVKRASDVAMLGEDA